MRFLPILLSLPLIAFSSPAPAQSPVKDIPPGEDEIVYLPEGQPAPYSGQLFSDPTALRWANWLRQYKTAYTVDMAAQTQLRQIEREAAAERLRAQKEYNEKVVEAYEKRLAGQSPAGAWYDTFWAGAVVGTIGATAIMAVGVWASSQ